MKTYLLTGMDGAPRPVLRLTARRQSGIALISSLLILIMLTLLAVAMFRGFGLQQKIGGNTREKERAHQAAQNALQYAEWWLKDVPAGLGALCASPNVISTPADMRICNAKLATPNDPSTWGGQSAYKPPTMIVLAGGGLNSGGTDVNYSKSPELHIAYLGVAPGGKQTLYSITAAGYGGSTTSTAVVQSVYAITSNIKQIDQP